VRALIVDDSADYRAMLTRRIYHSYPQALITDYNLDEQGYPGPGFDWSRYDILFLDYQLGHSCDRDGLDWLREFKGRANFPATIFLTAEGDEIVAVRALKLGAKDYIRKADLSSEVLKNAVDEALRSRGSNESTIVDEASSKTAEIRTEQSASLPYTEAAIAAGGIEIGNYVIKKLLGEGGMAVVYLAEDKGNGGEVAIKVLDKSLAQDERLIERFIGEYALLAEVQHPNLVRILGQGFTDDCVYIVMEYMGGGELRSVMNDSQLSLRQVLICIHSIVAGLQVLHSKGILHRDLKPANVLFRADASLALTDFGTAKRIDHGLDLTRHGEIMGTPYYMSPEQIQEYALDERSDLYSLGVMFYEMLANRRPFTARTASAIMYKHVNEEAEPIEGVPDKVNAIIRKLMAKKPVDRYVDAEKLQLDIATLM